MLTVAAMTSLSCSHQNLKRKLSIGEKLLTSAIQKTYFETKRQLKS